MRGAGGLRLLLWLGVGTCGSALPAPAPAPADNTSAPNASAASLVHRTYKDASLEQKSSAPLHTFYMYRAVSGEVYPPLNVNAANLAGVLWYLHHEVVIQYPRKFGITKIVRFQVQTRAPEPLYKLGMNFGPRGAFDKGQMTGPYLCGRNTTGASPGPKFCNGTFGTEEELMSYSGEVYNGVYEWSKYGYFVGCNRLGDWPYPEFQVDYPQAIWYSLPGPCPSMTYDALADGCRAQEPGGYCNSTPTGAGDCTWTYKYMGEVYIDELVGKSSDQLNNEGGREYDPLTDKGIRFSWWDGLNNETANSARMESLRALFEAKYPNQTKDEDMPSPTCDFNKDLFYKEYYWRDPRSGGCQDAKSGDDCFRRVKWGMRDGISGHPEWYPNLGPASSFKDFQRLLFAQGQCPYRPCEEGEREVVAEISAEAQNGTEGNSTGADRTSASAPGDTQKAGRSGVCVNAKPGDACYKTLTFAMQQGIYAHPEWYPGLTSASTIRDFQRMMYDNAFSECPYRPCEDGEKEATLEDLAPPQGPANASSNVSGTANVTEASNVTVVNATQATPVAAPSGPCATAKPGDDCYKAAVFAMQTGIFAHPDRYPNLSPSSSFKEFQEALFLSGNPQCSARPCSDAEDAAAAAAAAGREAARAYELREVWP